MLNLCVLGRIIYRGFCFVWVFNGPAPAVHLGTDHSFNQQRVCSNPFEASLPWEDRVINRPLSQFCFIEGDTVQCHFFENFCSEGNYRIVLCSEHSLVNSGVERQVSVAQGPTEARKIMTLDLIVSISPNLPPPCYLFIYFLLKTG